MPYLTNADTAVYLGETLTSPKRTQVNVLILAVKVAANSSTSCAQGWLWLPDEGL